MQLLNHIYKHSKSRCLMALSAIFLVACASNEVIQKPLPLTDFTPSISLKPQWSLDIGSAGTYMFSPAVINNSVIAVAANGRVTQVNASTGAVQWQARIDGDISSSPGSNGSVTAVVTAKGKVIALDDSGRQIWEQTVADEVLAAPLVTDSLVIVRTLANRIYAFEAINGKQRWLYQRAPAPLVLRTALGMVTADNALVAGFPGGKLGLINLDTGAIIWESTLTFAKGVSEIERLTDIAGRPAVRGNLACAAAFQGRIGCFDLSNANLVWSSEFSGTTGVAMDQNNVYAIDSKSIIHCYEASTGKALWRNEQLQWRNLGPARLDGKHMIAGDGEGAVYLISENDGKLLARLTTDGSAIASMPVLADDKFIVQTRKGNLYAFAKVNKE